MENNYGKKEEIINQVKELLNSDDPALAYSKAKSLSRRWGKVREEEESFYDKELSDEFNKIMAELAEKAGDIELNTEERKLAIIEKAKEVAAGSNFKAANEYMKDLLDQWKAAGHLNKERDDELWEQFSTIRKDFFDRKNEYYDKLKESFAQNKVLKEELIEKAKAVLDLEKISEAGQLTNELMDEWKKVGSAGRKDDETLWAQFLEQRKAFYKKRDEYYDSMKEVYAQRTEQKKELIAEAKLYLARSEFSPEEIESVRNLRTRWKEIGNAGKNNENRLWEEFNGIINKYYDNMRDYR